MGATMCQGASLGSVGDEDESDKSGSSVGFRPRLSEENAFTWAKAHATGTFVGSVNEDIGYWCHQEESRVCQLTGLRFCHASQ